MLILFTWKQDFWEKTTIFSYSFTYISSMFRWAHARWIHRSTLCVTTFLYPVLSSCICRPLHLIWTHNGQLLLSCCLTHPPPHPFRCIIQQGADFLLHVLPSSCKRKALQLTIWKSVAAGATACHSTLCPKWVSFHNISFPPCPFLKPPFFSLSITQRIAYTLLFPTLFPMTALCFRVKSATPSGHLSWASCLSAGSVFSESIWQDY